MDFGALEAMGPAAAGEAPQGARTISAASIFQGDAAERARIRDRHVFIGLTRIGAIDQHTTPMSFEAGVPGVLIQALAADNLISGRALAEPAWARLAVTGFLIALGALALVRFLMTSAPALAALGFALIAAPLALSWAAFAIGGMVIGGATPAIGAFLAVSPILYGRIAAIRRELATARESQARDEERMDAARSIQLGSLPFQADYTDIGFETASICRPAQEVGGDFFELFELTDGRLFAAVGDVSGKGLEASLVTALSKSISGAVTDRVPGPLGDGFREVSREFVRQAPRAWRREKGGFVTLVATRIDPASGLAEFASAGCEPPTVISASGEKREIVLPDVAPLGWIEDARFETASLQLAPGDTVIMFTDGVTEAETPAGALYGHERAETTCAAASDGAAAMVTALETAVLTHQAGGAPTDDTT
ncbi:MAG: SpoIIE family protein phosphatase, partial [Pseudomonadota bacterium]